MFVSWLSVFSLIFLVSFGVWKNPFEFSIGTRLLQCSSKHNPARLLQEELRVFNNPAQNENSTMTEIWSLLITRKNTKPPTSNCRKFRKILSRISRILILFCVPYVNRSSQEVKNGWLTLVDIETIINRNLIEC